MVRLLVASLCACLPATMQATAHAIIVDSVPAPLAHVQPGPLAVSLRYNSRIDAARSKLLLRHADDVQRMQTQPAATPDVLQADVRLLPGEYELQWQVLATDGHVTRGRVPFTVDASNQAAAAK